MATRTRGFDPVCAYTLRRKAQDDFRLDCGASQASGRAQRDRQPARGHAAGHKRRAASRSQRVVRAKTFYLTPLKARCAIEHSHEATNRHQVLTESHSAINRFRPATFWNPDSGQTRWPTRPRAECGRGLQSRAGSVANVDAPFYVGPEPRTCRPALRHLPARARPGPFPLR